MSKHGGRLSIGTMRPLTRPVWQEETCWVAQAALHEASKRKFLRKYCKSKTAFLVFLAGCGQGFSKPVFTARKVCRKRHLSVQKQQSGREKRFKTNCSVSWRKRVWVSWSWTMLRGKMASRTGLRKMDTIRQDFKSGWNHLGGYYPPNSSDRMLLSANVFGRFKAFELGSKPQMWVKHLDNTCQEIIDLISEGKHYIDDTCWYWIRPNRRVRQPRFFRPLQKRDFSPFAQLRMGDSFLRSKFFVLKLIILKSPEKICRKVS